MRISLSGPKGLFFTVSTKRQIHETNHVSKHKHHESRQKWNQNLLENEACPLFLVLYQNLKSMCRLCLLVLPEKL